MVVSDDRDQAMVLRRAESPKARRRESQICRKRARPALAAAAKGPVRIEVVGHGILP
ncbi:hypothetical protein ABLE91_26485 [Aquabacter sp. CN5-332]|uniref:hypothetical protein n=1 Tax=Aquabacter sp. CN5-332 TaxID=3156608 RepID=UPI0032B4D60F